VNGSALLQTKVWDPFYMKVQDIFLQTKAFASEWHATAKLEVKIDQLNAAEHLHADKWNLVLTKNHLQGSKP
jgi:hypothetical protein